MVGRGRGKAKKSTHDDPMSGNEEPLPTYKRRGRPQKPIKDDIDEEEAALVEENDGDVKMISPTKETKTTDNLKRRKKQSISKEDSDSPIEENGALVNSSTTTEESVQKNGFRQHGRRRKSKPVRAAEAGVQFY